MLTDRTDLDNQLFGTFARGRTSCGQVPVQAESRAHLRELLSAGGRRHLHDDPEVLPHRR